MQRLSKVTEIHTHYCVYIQEEKYITLGYITGDSILNKGVF